MAGTTRCFLYNYADVGDSTRTLLSLYQFEAHLRLNHHGDLQAILDSVSSQPRVELKTLEIMAGNCIQYYVQV